MNTTSPRPAIDIVDFLKDAAIVAILIGLLALPLAGFRTFDQNGTLQLDARWDWVLTAAVLGFFGRLILKLGLATFLPGLAASVGKSAGNIGHKINAKMTMIAGIAIGLAIIYPFADFILPIDIVNRRTLDLAILVMIYIMLGWGLNIVVGLAGLLDLGYVAFYAVGAYSYALLATHYDLSFWLCLPIAGIFAATFGIILGFPVLRLRGDYLAIVTLGFGEIIRVVLLNWYQFTGGPDGIASIPRPSFFGMAEFTRRAQEGVTPFHELFNIPFSSEYRFIFLYMIILALALLTNAVTLRLRKLPVGRAWEALREDEIACRSLGINPTNTKLSAFAIGALFGGFAGAFFATRQGFISPESFTFIESAIILAIVVLGGMGSQVGVVLASLVLILMPELFRDLQEFRMLAFGGLMFMVMVWKPRGLLAHRDPTVLLHPKGEPAVAGGAR